MRDLVQAMREYAQAIRGDWSDFDGRSERDVIETWAEAVETGVDRPIERWREILGLCPDGNGHWGGFGWGGCSEETCPVSLKLWGHNR